MVPLELLTKDQKSMQKYQDNIQQMLYKNELY
jgi:hypothetical protein